MLVFFGEGKTRSTWRKKSQSREENRQTQPTYETESGVEPGPPLCKGSVLTASWNCVNITQIC